MATQTVMATNGTVMPQRATDIIEKVITAPFPVLKKRFERSATRFCLEISMLGCGRS